MSRFCGVLVLLGVVSVSIPVWAQGGYADKELRRFRNQSLGRETSVESVNNRILSRTRGGVGNVGQGTPGTVAPTLRYTASNIGTADSGGPRNKPFSNYRPTPTVSPYLNLFREDLDGSDDLNYQTLVRPQMEQMQFNQQVSRQEMETARRIQSLSAQADFQATGSVQQAPTGHSTTFFNYSHYYPQGRRR